LTCFFRSSLKENTTKNFIGHMFLFYLLYININKKHTRRVLAISGGIAIALSHASAVSAATKCGKVIKGYYCDRKCLSFSRLFRERGQIRLEISVLRSRSRKEPHLLVGAGAVTRCGSGSCFDGSGSDNGIKHGWELKIDTKCNSL
jgi:hypothetical protein